MIRRVTQYYNLAVEAPKRLDKLLDLPIYVTPAEKIREAKTRAYEVLIEERDKEYKP